jgi:hypothetical protein
MKTVLSTLCAVTLAWAVQAQNSTPLPKPVPAPPPRLNNGAPQQQDPRNFIVPAFTNIPPGAPTNYFTRTNRPFMTNRPFGTNQFGLTNRPFGGGWVTNGLGGSNNITPVPFNGPGVQTPNPPPWRSAFSTNVPWKGALPVDTNPPPWKGAIIGTNLSPQ